MRAKTAVVAGIFATVFAVLFITLAPSVAHAEDLPVLDVCSNIEGVQGEVPPGMEQSYQGDTGTTVVCVPADQACPDAADCYVPSPVASAPVDVQLPTVPAIPDKHLALTGGVNADAILIGTSLILVGFALFFLAMAVRRY